MKVDYLSQFNAEKGILGTMNTLNLKKIGFLGLGLIGGSMAKAVKSAFPETEIIATAHSKGTVKAAFEDGIIANEKLLPLSAFADCGLIILCAPVDTNISYMKELSSLTGERTVITDVGSVKGGIMKAARGYGLSARFIGGHPMAGKEKGGYANSDPLILENAYYILTPTEECPDTLTSDMAEFVKALKSVPLVMSTEEHDLSTAAVSHVPHIIASSLVRLLAKTDGPEEHMKAIAAGGFRDITRIASSDPALWETIFLENRDEILRLLPSFEEEVEGYRKALKARDGEALKALFSKSKEFRDSIEIRRSGAVTPVFEFNIDIKDETGAIAKISTLLAEHSISLKNIGVVHNREFEAGVLHVEFYDGNAMDAAAALLPAHGYTLHR